MNISFTTLLIIFIIIVTLDKGLTLVNIKLVEHNFPNANATEIERNPVAKWMFNQFGVYGGTVFYWFVTIALMLVAYYSITSSWPSSQPYVLYGIFIIYGFVVANNSYFLLKYARIIP